MKLGPYLVREIYSHHNPFLVGHLQSVLESEGIACFVKNSYLSGAMGELPPTAVWPELWVIHDASFLRATKLLSDWIQEDHANT